MRHIRKIFEDKEAPILRSPEFLKRKQELVDYLGSLGFELEDDGQPYDMSGDGTAESLLTRFYKGDVMIVVALNNYTHPDPARGRKGNFAYQLRISMSKNAGGEVLLASDSKEAIAEDIQQLKKVVPKYVEQGRLKGLGVEDAEAGEVSDEEERAPSKREYEDMLNAALDAKDWRRATELQKKWGDKFYRESATYAMRHIRKIFEDEDYKEENLEKEESILRSPEFLRRKKELEDYLSSLGFENKITRSEDFGHVQPGYAEQLTQFCNGDVEIHVLLCYYFDPEPGYGNFMYQLIVSMSQDLGGERLLVPKAGCFHPHPRNPKSDEAIAEDIQQIKKVIPKYVEQGRLRGLSLASLNRLFVFTGKDARGVPQYKEPSKREYEDMLNAALDAKDWKKATELQKKWGDKFYRESATYAMRHLRWFR